MARRRDQFLASFVCSSVSWLCVESARELAYNATHSHPPGGLAVVMPLITGAALTPLTEFAARRLGMPITVTSVSLPTIAAAAGLGVRGMHEAWATLILALIYACLCVAVPLAAARFSGDRRMPGRCPHCGYELRGLRTHRCPECGKDTRGMV